MKTLKLKFLALCGLMILAAAFVAPVMAEDPTNCPLWPQDCGKGASCGCAGTPVGNQCRYDESCLNGGCCSHLDD